MPYEYKKPINYYSGEDNEKTALALLERGVDVKICDESGQSALHIASRDNNLKIVQELLKHKGIDMDLCDQYGDTALQFACKNGHVKVVKELLQGKAAINKVNKDGDSPLHTAVQNRQKEVVDELLKEDTINLNICNKLGTIPLHVACSGDPRGTLNFLNTELYDNSDRDKDIQMALSIIARGAHLNKCNREGRSPLHLALETCKIKIVKELLKHEEIDIELCDENKNTPLHLACKFSTPKVVKNLILRGASINKINGNGISPLHQAIEDNSSDDVIHELIKNDTLDINISNNAGSTPLHYACWNDLVSVVKSLILRGASINKVDDKGNSSLHIAIISFSYKIVNELLKAENIDMDVCNRKGNTPFNLLCDESSERQGTDLPIEKIALTLMMRCVDINKCDERGRSSLHKAAKNGKIKIVQEILKQSCVDICEENKMTPLHYACIAGQVKVVKELILKGASINKVDNKGCSPLHWAILYRREKVVDELVKQTNIQIDGRDNEGNTLLQALLLSKDIKGKYYDCDFDKHLKFGGNNNDDTYIFNRYFDDYYTNDYSLLTSFEKIAQALIMKKVDINTCDKNGQSLLHMVSAKGIINILQIILDHNESNVNLGDHNGNTPLHLACQYGQVIVVKILTKRGAGINTVNAKGDSALKMAILNKNENIVNHLLLESTIEINVCDKNGNSPLHIASSVGLVNVMKKLIQNGAHINRVNKIKQSPLHIAIDNDNDVFISALLKEENIDIEISDNDGCTPLYYASCTGRVKVVQKLIQRGASINKVDNYGESPLHKAIYHDKHDVINTLLQDDTTDIDVCNSNGNTSLHYACAKGFDESVTKIISKGASINKVNKDGDSPIHIAIFTNNDNVMNELLLKGNIDINVTNKNGYTPLYCACGLGNITAVKELIRNGASVNKFANGGCPPAYIAVFNVHEDVVEELLNHGDIDLNLLGLSLLHSIGYYYYNI